MVHATLTCAVHKVGLTVAVTVKLCLVGVTQNVIGHPIKEVELYYIHKSRYIGTRIGRVER